MAATATATLTHTPSKSRRTGPCWIRIGDHDDGLYLPFGVPVDLAAGDLTIYAKINDRHGATRMHWDVVVTGDPADIMHLVCGSPQAVEADLIGVIEAS